MSDRAQQIALEEEFDPTLIKDLRGMNYVPVAEVVSRLNKVLGVNNWSTTIVSIGRDEGNPEYVIAQVSISAIIDGKQCVADGVGGTKIKTLSGSNTLVDLGRDFKGAYSDALKKAAQRLGVGLHLARDEEAVQLDIVHPVPKESWDKLTTHIKALNSQQVELLKGWWAKNGDGPKPTYETITAEGFVTLVAQVKEIESMEFVKIEDAAPPVVKSAPEEPAMTPEEVAEAFSGAASLDDAPF